MRAFNKIFGVGLSRTGTTSLTRALELLGLRAKHHPLIEQYLKVGQYQIPQFERYDALLDIPVARVFKHFDRAYPGSVFILTEREIDSWLESCRVFFDHRQEHARGTHQEERLRFYWLLTYGCERFSADRLRQVYEDHRREVLTYFRDRRGDLLRLDVSAGDGWPELCGFLEAPIPETPYPQVNTLAEATQRRAPRYGLVTVTDPGYLPITEVMMRSFRRCNPWFRGTFVLIVENPEDAAYRTLRARPEIELLPVSSALTSRVRELCRTFPGLEAIYARFFSLEAFRLEGFARLVFVDSDTLFAGDVSHLFELERGLHAAPDSAPLFDQVREAASHRRVPLATASGAVLHDSFNAGLMVLGRNVRGHETHELLLEHLTPKAWAAVGPRNIADQIVLNRHFAGRVELLSFRDNFFVRNEGEIRRKTGVLAHEARLFHFLGNQKPWLRLPEQGFAIAEWKFIEAWRREFRELVSEAELSPEERWPLATKRVFPDGFAAALDTGEIADVSRDCAASAGTVAGAGLHERRRALEISRRRLAEEVGVELVRAAEANTDSPVPVSFARAWQAAVTDVGEQAATEVAPARRKGLVRRLLKRLRRPLSAGHGPRRDGKGKRGQKRSRGKGNASARPRSGDPQTGSN